MKIAIVYSSTEGQTRKIVLNAVETLVGDGHTVALLPAADAADAGLEAFDAIIAAASVHGGRYQSEMVDFASRHAGDLSATHTLFLSVSLGAAGDNPDDWAELDRIVERFSEQTGWTPGRVEHVAGAFRFSDYDFFKYWAMRWIETQKDPGQKPGTDREYTDWAALRELLRDWTDHLSPVT